MLVHIPHMLGRTILTHALGLSLTHPLLQPHSHHVQIVFIRMTNEKQKPRRLNSHTKPPSINLSHPTHDLYCSGCIASYLWTSERPASSSKLFPRQLKHRARPTHPVQVGQPSAASFLIYPTQTLLHCGPSLAPKP